MRSTTREIGRRQLRRRRLLGAVSSAAILAASTLAVSAADIFVPPPPPPPPHLSLWWVALEGSYDFFGPGLDLAWGAQDEAIAGTFVHDEGEETSGYDPLDLQGWNFAAEVGYRPASGPGDIVIRFRYDTANEDIHQTWEADFPDEDVVDGGDATYDEYHAGLDFEIGREVGVGSLGGMGLRIYAGARFTHYAGNVSFETYQYEEFEEEEDGETEGCEDNPCEAEGTIDRYFTGFGPRIGFDAGLPIGGGGFGVAFGASGAALFGRRATEWNFSEWELGEEAQGSQPEPDFNNSVFDVVPNLEAYAALTWSPWVNSTFSLGWRVDAYWDVMDTGWPGFEDGPGTTDRVINGPFLKGKIGFN